MHCLQFFQPKLVQLKRDLGLKHIHIYRLKRNSINKEINDFLPSNLSSLKIISF